MKVLDAHYRNFRKYRKVYISTWLITSLVVLLYLLLVFSLVLCLCNYVWPHIHKTGVLKLSPDHHQLLVVSPTHPPTLDINIQGGCFLRRLRTQCVVWAHWRVACSTDWAGRAPQAVLSICILVQNKQQGEAGLGLGWGDAKIRASLSSFILHKVNSHKIRSDPLITNKK